MNPKKLFLTGGDPNITGVTKTSSTEDYSNSVVNGFNASKFRFFEQNCDEKAILANIITSIFKGRKNLIDVGAGTGSLTAKLLESKRNIIAIEPCADFYPLLREKLGDNNSVLCTSFENAEIKRGNADGVIFSHSLYYIKLSPAIFNKIRNSLRDDGKVAFIVFAPFGDQYDILTELNFSNRPGTPIFKSRYFDLKYYLGSYKIRYSELFAKSHFCCGDKNQLAQVLSFMLGIDINTVMRNWERKIMPNKGISKLVSALEDGNHVLISTAHAIITVTKKELDKLAE